MLFGSSGSGLGGKGDSGGALGAFYNYTIDQSLRIDNASGAYLTISSASPTATNRKKVTISCWVKRAGITVSGVCTPFWADSAGLMLQFFADNSIYIYDNNISLQAYVQPTSGVSRLFRDPSAWYHLALIIDTTQSTAADRAKFYVNGTLQALSAYPGQNVDVTWHTGTTMRIGSVADTQDLAGYIAEFISIDGQNVAISDLAETKDGVWVPKDVSGLTLGNAGFYLKFDNNSDIGNDSGSNNIDFTGTNLAAHDVVPDSPTNNFTTFSPIDAYNAGSQLSNGNLTYKGASANDGHGATQTFDIANDKFYWEVHIAATNSWIGIIGEDFSSAQKSGNVYSGSGMYAINPANGNKSQNPYAAEASYTTAASAGDVIGFACGDGKITIYYNGTSKGDMYTSLTGRYKPFIMSATSAVSTFNFGQDHTFNGNKTSGSDSASDANGIGIFYDTPPSGHLALCTSNLPDITIGPGQDTQADDHFNTVLYTGTGASHNITGVGFQPDWVWVKRRSSPAYGHAAWDSVRGVTKAIVPNSPTTEFTSSGVTSFDSDGFTIGSAYNESSETSVAWNWKAGGAPTADNSAGVGATPTAGSVKIDGSNLSSALAGSIAATRLSASTTSGFSIIKWTGNQTNNTLAHGLSSTPEIVIVKNLDYSSANWYTWNKDLTNNKVLFLNDSGGETSSASSFIEGDMTATTVGLGTERVTNGNNEEMVAYVFHSVEGYSKVGKYTGNGNADGTFVYTGFRPAWVIIKRTATTGSWNIADSVRSPANEVDEQLQSNVSNVESTTFDFDFLSNGFKARTTDSARNASSGTYIYLAFAEAPFKFANAR